MRDLSGRVYSPLAIDKTLTKEYMCADAKATGDAIKKLNKWSQIATNNASEYAISIPECNDVICEVVNSNNVALLLEIPYDAINGKTREYYVGGFVADKSYFGAKIIFANNKVYFKDSYLNGAYDSTARINVFCRGER